VILTGRKLTELSRAPTLAGPRHTSRLPIATECRPAHNDRIRCINDYMRLGAPAASLSWPDPAELGVSVPLFDQVPVPPGDRSLAGVSIAGQTRCNSAFTDIPGTPLDPKTHCLSMSRWPLHKLPRTQLYVLQSRLGEKLSFYHCFSANPKGAQPLQASRAFLRVDREKLSFSHCFSANSKGTEPLRASRPCRSAHLENSAFINVLIVSKRNIPSCATALTNASDLSPLQTEGALLRPVVQRYNYGFIH